MAAGQAQPEMDPASSETQALLAAIRSSGCYRSHQEEVRIADYRHGRLRF